MPARAAEQGEGARLDEDQLHQLFTPLFPGLMGIRFIDLAPDRVVAEPAVRADLCTTGGILCVVVTQTQLVQDHGSQAAA